MAEPAAKAAAARMMEEALSDDEAQAPREAFCRLVSEALASTGDRLVGGFKLMGDPFGRSVGLLSLMAGELSGGACDLLAKDNLYGAAALVRQLIEVEYLLWVFAEDPSEVDRWWATDHRTDYSFKPSANRKRAGKHFRLTEYQAHCETGGHPVPLGSLAFDDTPFRVRTQWSDLAQHSARVWHELVCCCAVVDRPAVTSHYEHEVKIAKEAWRSSDGMLNPAIDELLRKAGMP